MYLDKKTHVEQDVLQLILDCPGIDVNARSELRSSPTPLLVAARNARVQLETLKNLIEAGAERTEETFASRDVVVEYLSSADPIHPRILEYFLSLGWDLHKMKYLKQACCNEWVSRPILDMLYDHFIY